MRTDRLAFGQAGAAGQLVASGLMHRLFIAAFSFSLLKSMAIADESANETLVRVPSAPRRLASSVRLHDRERAHGFSSSLR
jgi:hypothetical protein